MKLRESVGIDLYTNRSFLKWFVLTVSVIIGSGSILYTNRLVKEIRERERRQVALYARTLEYLANEVNPSSELIFMLDEIVQANTTIPVILTDLNGTPEDYRNIPRIEKFNEEERELYLRHKITEMMEEHEPIEVKLVDLNNRVYGGKLIYYENSYLLTQLQFYPYIQLLVISLFGLITFTIFNYSRSSEQNRVWVGLAKETAHQLGTPLSSLMAWVEYLKSHYPSDPNLLEFDKDISRLSTITSRFSSIGSVPNLQPHDLNDVVDDSVSYLRDRLSKKIVFRFEKTEAITTVLNTDLFSWVLENLIKNAVDAMDGHGSITIVINKLGKSNAYLDISDTGKGISKSRVSKIFTPGYTTKKRGWGLGLTLVKRIVENYHEGRIFVKKSDSRGTTFRIVLKTH